MFEKDIKFVCQISFEFICINPRPKIVLQIKISICRAEIFQVRSQVSKCQKSPKSDDGNGQLYVICWVSKSRTSSLSKEIVKELDIMSSRDHEVNFNVTNEVYQNYSKTHFYKHFDGFDYLWCDLKINLITSC